MLGWFVGLFEVHLLRNLEWSYMFRFLGRSFSSWSGWVGTTVPSLVLTLISPSFALRFPDAVYVAARLWSAYSLTMSLWWLEYEDKYVTSSFLFFFLGLSVATAKYCRVWSLNRTAEVDIECHCQCSNFDHCARATKLRSVHETPKIGLNVRQKTSLKVVSTRWSRVDTEIWRQKNAGFLSSAQQGPQNLKTWPSRIWKVISIFVIVSEHHWLIWDLGFLQCSVEI